MNTFKTLCFYNLLEQPLSLVEILKYLPSTNAPNKPITIGALIKNIPFFKKPITLKNGFFFIPTLLPASTNQRIKKEKISAQKWKKIKKICSLMRFIPFTRGAGISGSLTLYNARKESDFDFIVIAQKGKIWTTRALMFIFLSILNQKRFGQNTKDKVCLNCFITDDSLEIKEHIKPHNFYSAQEYSRIVPIFENTDDLWHNFKKANLWIKNYLASYPWPSPSFYFQKNNNLANFIRHQSEKILDFGSFGLWLENILKNYQIKRIKKNLTNSPDDQIFFSDQYLFFHPHSKSLKILDKLDKIMAVDNSI